MQDGDYRDRQRLVADLLGPLHMHFLDARSAYAAYLDNGRAFFFASTLRRINESARALLLREGHRLPEPLQADAAALIGHYDAWIGLWDAHAARLDPAPSDPFAFENSHTYPRESEQRLMALFDALRGG